MGTDHRQCLYKNLGLKSLKHLNKCMTKLFIVMTKTKYIKCKEWQEEELHEYKQGKALTFLCLSKS